MHLPRLLVVPIVKALIPIVHQIFRGAVIEPRVKFMDNFTIVAHRVEANIHARVQNVPEYDGAYDVAKEPHLA